MSNIYANNVLLFTQKKENKDVYPTLVVCLVSAFYNPSLQLQRLGPFVVILWLCNIL